MAVTRIVQKVLQELKVARVEDVLVGQLPATEASTDLELAVQHSRDFVRNPLYYAKPRNETAEEPAADEIIILKSEYQALVAAGAVEDSWTARNGGSDLGD